MVNSIQKVVIYLDRYCDENRKVCAHKVPDVLAAFQNDTFVNEIGSVDGDW